MRGWLDFDKEITFFRSGEQLVSVLLCTDKEQHGQSLRKEFSSEEESDTEEDSSDKREQESNTEEVISGASQNWIVCLRVELEKKEILSKDDLLDIAVKWKPADDPKVVKQLLTEESSIVKLDRRATDVPLV